VFATPFHSAMHLTLDDIRATFDAGTFARGQDYARSGKVLHVERQGDTVSGVVEGSGRGVYHQSIALRPGRNGVRIAGECTCPVTRNCKHVVAVLLEGLDPYLAAPPKQDAVKAAPSPERALAARTDDWLWRMAQLQDYAEAGGKQPPSPKYSFAWALLRSQRSGAFHLHLCKVGLRKDGSISGATIPNNIHGLLGGLPDADEETIRLFAALSSGSGGGNDIKPAGRMGARLLARMCGNGRLLAANSVADLKAGRLAMLRPGLVRPASLAWAPQDADSGAVALRWCFDDGAAVNVAVAHVMGTEPMLYLHDGLLGEVRAPAAIAALPPGALQDLLAQAPRLEAHERAGMAQRMAGKGLDRILPLPQVLETRQRSDVPMVPYLILNGVSAMARGYFSTHATALLAFEYDGMLAEDPDERVLRRMQGDALELIARDDAAEAAAAATLAALGFAAPAPRSPLEGIDDALVLPTEAAWLAFTHQGIARLQAAGWQVVIDVDFPYEVVQTGDWYADLVEESEGGDWFSLELGILIDGARWPLLPLLLQMIRKAPQDFGAAALAARDDGDAIYLQLPDEVYVALPWARVKPILATLGELYFSDRVGDALRLPVTDAGRLAELEAAIELRWLGGERLRDLGRKLRAFDGIHPVPAPAGLQATLRPYQLAGLAWMQFLREYDFGGILADDMGLGKTVQTLAHLLVEKEAGRLDRPALVVAPTSLMANWQAEAARFAPGLRVLLVHGKERQASFDEIGNADLVLTTYPLLGRDEEALRRHRYHLLILDEAQYVKNSKARAAQVVRLLDARHRLCLSGTPVQNHLGEIWALFHFLMPGLLGDEKSFNSGFRKPIEKGADAVRADLLARRLKPFMLRRTKDKVATELPPKTEIVLPVDLVPAQRDLYETVRVAMDKKVRDEIDRKGLARSQIVILDALLKLRQVCCDPRLLKSHSVDGSAKLEALLDLLHNLLSEGRKVLVFSQFTSMLALIGEELAARGIDFGLLTGDTIDRAGQVDAFQQGQVSIFLISLKAGGVGLNLTAADTVIHYDPWWNPAAENQATDRAWRIGQAQPVFVYKLIARGTLEEKIQDMQRRKGELAQALLSPEGGLAAGVGPEELQAMFALL
jgi:hypothetical protein